MYQIYNFYFVPIFDVECKTRKTFKPNMKYVNAIYELYFKNHHSS